MARVYRISEFAERIGRSASTVRRWEAEGRIAARRTSTGQRYFDESDVLAVLAPGFARDDRKVIVYCRVSSAGQREDLASQRAAMEMFCLARGLAVDEWVSEIGGGMDLLRPKLIDIMSRVKAGQVSTLVVAHEDRLARFGFDYLAHEAEAAGCEVLVANQESLSPQEEMVADLLAIVHTFSYRLDGLHRYAKSMKTDDLIGR
ncbi:IS607 family transposase ISSto12 [Catellatospora sp. TT07R-123]|uniref:IS607 family transposase n=1 Tax=Catellatospora sp. TT07R-123 TaxID=2733863 RepID=UPI001B1B41B1|nr:IS607 family transposase [Catellatospora sp. TT07R-123]GHJ47359.1 IS607 family transposase ISSto12 [Catellatospora sp. TT07R-123]